MPIYSSAQYTDLQAKASKEKTEQQDQKIQALTDEVAKGKETAKIEHVSTRALHRFKLMI